MDDDGLRRASALGLAALALLWGAGLILGAFTVPAYKHLEPGRSWTTTLVEENGLWVVLPVAVPVLLAAVVSWMLYRRLEHGSKTAGRVAWLGIGLLSAFAIVSLASVGVYVLPVAFFLGGAAVLVRRQAARRY